MVLLGHESMEGVRASAALLKQLGPHARKVLSESVEATGVKRKQLSKAAKDLETAGFLFVRDLSSIWQGEYELLPTLAGEEALEYLDELNCR